MLKQQKNICEMANVIRAQTMTLLVSLVELGLGNQADQCERLHEDSEALYQSLVAKFGEKEE